MPEEAVEKGLCSRRSRASSNGLTLHFDERSPDDGPAELSESVVNPLQDALGRRPQLRRGVVRQERAAGGPDGGVRDALDELEREDEPGPRDEGYVQESEAVAEETRGKNLES